MPSTTDNNIGKITIYAVRKGNDNIRGEWASFSAAYGDIPDDGRDVIKEIISRHNIDVRYTKYVYGENLWSIVSKCAEYYITGDCE